MQSLECMTSFVKRTQGDVPGPLVGPSTTLVANKIYLFGGRTVAERRIESALYVLDLPTLVWSRIHGPREDSGMDSKGRQSGDDAWPSARYFHTMDHWNGKLVLFGGMGVVVTPITSENPSTTPQSTTAAATAVQPCVLDDLWLFDIASGTWEECGPELPRYTSSPPSPTAADIEGSRDDGATEPVSPMARYAHLSAVIGDRLLVIGGQEISNEYVFQQVIFHLPSRRWESSRVVPGEVRGSYRSVAVPVEWEEVLPAGGKGTTDGDMVAGRLTYSRERQGGNEKVLTPEGDVLLFSNSNFTDVHRELHALSLEADGVRTTDLTPRLESGTPSGQPPGLRFPFATLVGHHLIVGGTYLSASAQQFALWSLDLVTWQWAKIDAEVLEGTGERVVRNLSELVDGGIGKGGLSGGSWNRGVWAGEGRLFLFGNRYRSLQEDYEHRAINLDHVAIIELEVFGIYRPPMRHPALRPTGSMEVSDRTRIESALRALHDGRLQDCQVVCEDGRAIGCSSRVLEARWDWFKQRRTPSIPFASTTLHISESYPIVKAFLEYMYTLDLVTVLQHRIPVLSGLLMLAKQHGVPHLEALAVHALHGRLDEGTALGIYEVATLCECRPLQVRALKMVLAIQKRAGKGTHHRRQQSGTVPATQESGLAPPPLSEGDSARTINGNSAVSGARDGNTYQATQRAVASSRDHLAMAFSSPPSAFSTPRKRRVTPSRRFKRNYPVAGDSPVVPRSVRDDSDDTRSSEATEYEPATYRTRRRSASVATVHHFEDGDVVDERGMFVTRVRKSAQGKGSPPLLPVGEGRRAVRLARKIASMGSLFHVPERRPVLHIKVRPARSGEGDVRRAGSDMVRATSSDSSTPSSPVTPTDLPLLEERETRAASPRAIPFPFLVKEPELSAKLDVLSLKGHNRTRSLGFQGVW